MDKLTIATQVLLKLIETNKTGFDAEGISGYAWEITDAMQAEAEKREDKTRPEVLEEWQLDWSQAPDDATAWEYLGHGSARWHTTTKGMYRAADLFGYSGTDMLLVERPHGF